MTEGENMVERCARALCDASGVSWKEPPYNRLHTDAGNNHWRFKARAVIEALMTAADGNAIHSFALSYEFRDPDYSPTDAERVMIEDAICGFVSALSQPNDEGEGK